jgi:hypothetical protein
MLLPTAIAFLRSICTEIKVRIPEDRCATIDTAKASNEPRARAFKELVQSQSADVVAHRLLRADDCECVARTAPHFTSEIKQCMKAEVPDSNSAGQCADFRVEAPGERGCSTFRTASGRSCRA